MRNYQMNQAGIQRAGWLHPQGAWGGPAEG
jgi:hypothetical protein